MNSKEKAKVSNLNWDRDSPLEKLDWAEFIDRGIRFYVKRDDLLDNEIQGNKWRKLKYNVSEYAHSGKRKWVTMGGAYSNHLAATAAACARMNIPVLGLVRGDELRPDSNETLLNAQAYGMEFEFISRTKYRFYRDHPEEVKKMYPEAFFVPEGGTNAAGIRGVAELIEETGTNFDSVFAPVGTGGTLAGLVKGLNGRSWVYGVSSLKGEWINQKFKELLVKEEIFATNYTLVTDDRFGGYAKDNDELAAFIRDVAKNKGFFLDPIYTAKVLFYVLKLVEQGQLDGKKCLFLHTGGLQGLKPWMQKTR